MLWCQGPNESNADDGTDDAGDTKEAKRGSGKDDEGTGATWPRYWVVTSACFSDLVFHFRVLGTFCQRKLRETMTDCLQFNK